MSIGSAPVPSGVAIFGYGSLVNPVSAAATLGRPVGEVVPARLSGWRRRFSAARDNVTSEKTFTRVSDGWVPPIVLALNLERDATMCADSPNGAVIEVTPEELDRLDRRELRYDRVEVTDVVQTRRCSPGLGLRIYAYIAKSEHLAVRPPPGAVVLASYVAAVEGAFSNRGAEELAAFWQTTGRPPVEVIEARLVRGEVTDGNPRDW